MELTRGKIRTPERVVIYGPEGVGKTELASRFPAPVFMDTENSTSHIDCVRTPVPTSFAHAMQIVAELARDTHGMKTLVVDTVDWLERLALAEVLATNSAPGGKEAKGIEDYGYGKGHVYLAEKMGKVLDALSDLGAKTGMHIVLTAHAQTKKFELPEEEGTFDRWSMKLSKHLEPTVKEWASMVLFLSYKTLVEVEKSRGGETTKAKARGSLRVLRTQKSATWDAKNRHGLAAEMPAEIINGRHEGWDALKHLFVEAAGTPVPAPGLSAGEGTSAPPEAPAASHLDKLRAVMAESGVTYDELLKQIVLKGYFPAGTPIGSLTVDFVEGKLLPAWPQVLDLIRNARTKKD
jgi:hypothetical protein